LIYPANSFKLASLSGKNLFASCLTQWTTWEKMRSSVLRLDNETTAAKAALFDQEGSGSAAAEQAYHLQRGVNMKLANTLVPENRIRTTNAQRWLYALGNLGCAIPYQTIGAVILFSTWMCRNYHLSGLQP
jgi:hypothetical protein